MPSSHDDKMLAINQALVLGSLRQHELVEATNALNLQLQREVAERKQAEAALHDSEATLRQLNADLERKVLEGSRALGRNNLVDAIESLDHGLVLYDREDRLVLFNHYLYEQYPLADRYFIVGRTFEQIFTDLVETGAETPAAGQTKEAFIAGQIAQHRRADGAVTETEQQDGSILHFSEHRSQSQGFVSICRDVSSQVNLAQQLREAQKMEAIGRLTGGLAHDLNNYLAVIIGNLDLLAELPHGDRAKKFIDGAISGTLRGAELTRSLLAFSRRQPLDPKVTDIGETIANMTRLLTRTLGEDIVVNLRVAKDLWPVKIDSAQLDTCVVNLANNARDAMPHGGKLSISLRNVSATDADAPRGETVGNAAARDNVLIEFADTGSGMGKETLARIFEPFFTTKGPGHGTGLGLSMVHGFVHQSDGIIRVTSVVGEGTIVRIYLLRASGAQAESAPAQVATPLPRGDERVLVVEDNEHVRAALSDQLGSLGYTVVTTENGDAALALLEGNAGGFDLVLTDVVMPGRIDGHELARIALARWPGVAMLIASGYSGDSCETPDIDTTVAVLRKPYRRADLARALRAGLDDRRAKAIHGGRQGGRRCPKAPS